MHNSTRVIDACLRLHNFLVDYGETYAPERLKRTLNTEDEALQKVFEEECNHFSQLYPDQIIGVFGDNINEETGRRKYDKLTERLKKLGELYRDKIATKLYRKGYVRPRVTGTNSKHDKPIYRRTNTNQCLTL